ncbi:MAG: prolyl aminopeptidase [Chlamydiae bacterium]|jgi:proline iminopeptidase|nr:prolyl aminopeptidase [Chlamydiota bacterium]
MRSYYPEIKAQRIGYIEVDQHEIYFEESGNLSGAPLLFLHGGPGSGTEEKHRRFFDPETYRIILMDQRGCGKSRPHASLENNTTWDLVKDIEELRKFLGIDKWVVFGGSWGSTLSLAYAETYPERVKGLILRGIFLSRKEELDWFFQKGASFIFPEEWEKFVSCIPENERSDLLSAYYKRLISDDRKKFAYAWSRWEAIAVRLELDRDFLENFTEDFHADAVARIEAHYFINKAFFETDNWLIENAYRIKDIPTVIIHGRYDMICPVKNAWDLFKVLANARLEIIPNAGHGASEPGILDALIRASDEFSKL